MIAYLWVHEVCIVYTLSVYVCVYHKVLNLPSFGHGGQSPFTSTEDSCSQAASNGGCHQDTSNKAPNSTYDNTGPHERMVSVITAWTELTHSQKTDVEIV